MNIDHEINESSEPKRKDRTLIFEFIIALSALILIFVLLYLLEHETDLKFPDLDLSYILDEDKTSPSKTIDDVDYKIINTQGIVNDQSSLSEIMAKAKEGDANAQYQLGGVYAFAKGVPQNYEEALKWYRLAAKQGLPKSQYNVGWIYYLGKGE